MNEFANVPRGPATTRAADGLPRFKWSLAQFDQLIEHGILTEQDHIELIGGELVPMAPKGNRHEVVKEELHDWLALNLPRDLKHSVELGWRPDGETYLEPDLLIYSRGIRAPEVPAGEVLLLIEVARSSLEFDQGAKARVYAALGVREYWVVDAVTLSTRVFREPSAQGYGAWRDVPPEDTLSPCLVPALAVSLGGLGIG